MHKSIEIEKLFDEFCEEIIFVFKSIKNLSFNARPNYDINLNILESVLCKTNRDDFNSNIKYE